MEYYYTAYTKAIQDTTFYFVKKYITFPEYKDMEPVLESYGMHTDFITACKIASLNDEEIRKNLFEDLQNQEINAKVIHMNVGKGISAVQ
jgi:hypothetical protein